MTLACLVAAAVVAGAVIAGDGPRNLIETDFTKGLGAWQKWGTGGDLSTAPAPDDPARTVMVLTVKGEGHPTAVLPEIAVLKPGHTYRMSVQVRLEAVEGAEPVVTRFGIWANVAGKLDDGGSGWLDEKATSAKRILTAAAVQGQWTESCWEHSMPENYAGCQIKVAVRGSNFRLYIRDPKIVDVTNALFITSGKRLVVMGQAEEIVFTCRMPAELRKDARLVIRMPDAKEETVTSPGTEVRRTFRPAQRGKAQISGSLSIPGEADPIDATLEINVAPAVVP